MRLVLLHGQSIYFVLNQRCLTRRILFKYLSDNSISIGNVATKTDLVEKTVNYWRERFGTSAANTDSPVAAPKVISSKDENITINVHNEITKYETVVNITQTPADRAQDHVVSTLPLQQMAEQFVQWFFDKLNKCELQNSDLWPDSTCAIRLIDSNNMNQDSTSVGDASVRELFLDLRRSFNFEFNPNVCHLGVQGKMNPFGMVMVASCGTIHTNDVCVGVFESAFGLIRTVDEAGDTWKLKHTKMQIKSTAQPSGPPSLQHCETLQDILMLPVKDGMCM